MTEALRWDAGARAWAPAGAPPAGAVLAADSWLVADGRVRGWEHHWARFAGSAPVAVAAGDVAAALPREGRWFPRIELRAGGELRLLLRPAPEPRPEAAAWVADVPDPRREPRVKGPDLERLAALRERAAAHGADEALIADRDGRLLEGAWSSLLWWEDGTLWAVPGDAPILPGVTRRLLLEIAAADGVPTAFRRPAPEELRGRETWLTSALHGIRTISGWGGGARHAPAWRERLDALARPL